MAKRKRRTGSHGGPCAERGLSLLLTALLLWPAAAHADDPEAGKEKVETEHIFGFTEGTDIGRKGEQEFESTTVGRFGAAGRYTGIPNKSAYRNVLFDGFRLSFAALSDYYSIHSMPAPADRNRAGFSGVASELRWQFSDRSQYPIGISVSLMPEYRWIEEVSGANVQSYAMPAVLALDGALIPGKAFWAFNLIYDPQLTRAEGKWERGTQLEASGAASYAVMPDVFLGAELRSLAWDEQGATLSRGLFAGPSLYVQLSKDMAIKVAWSAEIAEETRRGPSLSNLERNQAILLFVKSF